MRSNPSAQVRAKRRLARSPKQAMLKASSMQGDTAQAALQPHDARSTSHTRSEIPGATPARCGRASRRLRRLPRGPGLPSSSMSESITSTPSQAGPKVATTLVRMWVGAGTARWYKPTAPGRMEQAVRSGARLYVRAGGSVLRQASDGDQKSRGSIGGGETACARRTALTCISRRA